MQVNLLSFSTKDENSDFTKHKTLIEIFKKTVENYKEKVPYTSKMRN